MKIVISLIYYALLRILPSRSVITLRQALRGTDSGAGDAISTV